MKLLTVTPLMIPDVLVIRFARFTDVRGYFTETYRRSDFGAHPELGSLAGLEFVQTNESFSRTGTIRGLHFQWNPFMGKLVRCVHGRMVDLVLDIRRNSPTLGKILAYDMPSNPAVAFNEWIWVPPGMAHGNLFAEDTTIEYMCSGEYSPGCEAGISPLSEDIDWSLCQPALQDEFVAIARTTALMTDKDRNGFSLGEWLRLPESGKFIYGSV